MVGFLTAYFSSLPQRTESILFRWSALENDPVKKTELSLAGSEDFSQSSPFDWFHMNSIVNIGDRFLETSRHVWTTCLITDSAGRHWWRTRYYSKMEIS